MNTIEILLIISIYSLFLLHGVISVKQDVLPMRFAIEGRNLTIPCSIPGDDTYLKWKFRKNGTNFNVDAAQVFPGNIVSVFNEFNEPPGRTDIIRGKLVIFKLEVKDEGGYWCEISTVTDGTKYSKIYPIHIYVTPQKPQLTPFGTNTITEYENKTIARCSSTAGKPGSSIIWYNGTKALTSKKNIVYVENAFKYYLTDGTADFRIHNPTRFDHNRTFSCVVDHPAYEGKPVVLNYTILVKYHPVNIRLWANLTSKHIFCHADAFPAPTYYWVLPGDVTGFKGESIYIDDLFNLPGYEYFECIASNGIPPNATIRVKVDDLVWPDGKPGWLGLDWWVWGVILGSVAFLIVVGVIIFCCVRRRKSSDKVKSGKYIKPIKKPLGSPQHPTTLKLDSVYNRRDTREDSFDSRTPSPVNVHKQQLIGGMYSKSQENITLIPSDELRRSRENVFADNRKSMHASIEQLDQVAGHIQTLNKSWDQLSKSRQQLNDAQEELHYAAVNVRQSREDLYHSREALNRDEEKNYPYIDSAEAAGNTYRCDQQYDEQDQYRGDPPKYTDQPGYDNRYDEGQGYGDNQQGYNNDTYNNRQGYDGYRDGSQYNYGDTYNRDTHDGRNGYDDGYRQDQYSGYDDRSGYRDQSSYDYNDGNQGYGYQDDQYDSGRQYNRRIV